MNFSSRKSHPAHFILFEQALIKGLPDWNYNGKVWEPLDEPEGWEEITGAAGEKLQKIHVLTRTSGD